MSKIGLWEMNLADMPVMYVIIMLVKVNVMNVFVFAGGSSI